MQAEGSNMTDEEKKAREAPETFRIWDENIKALVEAQAVESFGGSKSAVFNVALMRWFGKSDPEIEAKCKEFMRVKR
jgi:hypothetical protein